MKFEFRIDPIKATISVLILIITLVLWPRQKTPVSITPPETIDSLKRELDEIDNDIRDTVDNVDSAIDILTGRKFKRS